MFSQYLKEEVDKYYEKIKNENALFVNAKNGKLKAKNIEKLLYNICYTISHTSPHLQRAAEKSKEVGKLDYSNYLSKKYDEEKGHDEWANADLESIRRNYGSSKKCTRSENSLHLIKYIEEVIEKNPIGYFGYFFFAEYFNVISTDEIVGNMVNKCGLSKDSFSVLTKHVEHDEHHVEEGLEEIDRFVTTDKDKELVKNTMFDTMKILDNFWEEVGAA